MPNRLLPPLVSLLLLAGCGDAAAPTAPAANATAAGAGTADAAATARPPLASEGRLDRSHKGSAAPALPFTAPGGRTVTLAAFRGAPTLVNLWATWCAPCKAEMPTLDALAAREGERLNVVAISQDLTGGEAVTPFWTASGFRALQPYLDTEVGFSTTLAATLPMTILYDGSGREVWRMTGGMDWAGPRAATLIAEAR